MDKIELVVLLLVGVYPWLGVESRCRRGVVSESEPELWLESGSFSSVSRIGTGFGVGVGRAGPESVLVGLDLGGDGERGLRRGFFARRLRPPEWPA